MLPEPAIRLIIMFIPDDEVTKDLIDIVYPVVPMVKLAVLKSMIEGKRVREMEKLILADEYALKYVRSMKMRWVDLEEMMSPRLLLEYAKGVGRIDELDHIILSDLEIAIEYCKEVRQERWGKLEMMLITNPHLIYRYLRDVVKEALPGVEEYLLTGDRLSYIVFIAKDLDLLLQHPYLCYLYARLILEGRWVRGEESIASDALSSFLYAKEVIKGPFPKGERSILSSPSITRAYTDEVVRDRWLEAEAIYGYSYHA